jgi:septal ring factor EnvC (AmiA/AmiB activator)
MKFKLLTYLLFCTTLLPAQQSVKELEKERLATLAEIEETNRLLSENTLTTSNALNRLTLLAQQINSRKKLIELLNQEIGSLDIEIGSKETQIQSLEKGMEAKKQLYAASVRKIYSHKNNQDNLLFILSSQSFTQSFRRIMYLKAFSDWQKKQAEEITEKQKTINEDKKQLIANRSNKLNLLGTRQSEENKLTEEEANKKVEIITLQRDKKKLQSDLAKKEEQASALNRQTEKIIAEEVIKSEEAAKSGNSENRTVDIKGGYAMTETERSLSSTFAGNKGNLPFPLKGNYKVTGYFGVHPHKDLPKVVTNNNGIDIETTSGNEARAVFNGVVSRVFTLPGYNNSIIIRHGNYLTLYSNIEQVYVKQGDKVNTGQPVGKIYTNSEKGNSTSLHFEIRKEKDKLDPLLWIK